MKSIYFISTSSRHINKIELNLIEWVALLPMTVKGILLHLHPQVSRTTSLLYAEQISLLTCLKCFFMADLKLCSMASKKPSHTWVSASPTIKAPPFLLKAESHHVDRTSLAQWLTFPSVHHLVDCYSGSSWTWNKMQTFKLETTSSCRISSWYNKVNAHQRY